MPALAALGFGVSQHSAKLDGRAWVNFMNYLYQLCYNAVCVKLKYLSNIS